MQYERIGCLAVVASRYFACLYIDFDARFQSWVRMIVKIWIEKIGELGLRQAEFNERGLLRIIDSGLRPLL